MKHNIQIIKRLNGIYSIFVDNYYLGGALSKKDARVIQAWLQNDSVYRHFEEWAALKVSNKINQMILEEEDQYGND